MRLGILKRGLVFQAGVTVIHAAIDQEGKRLPEVWGWIHDCVNVVISGGAGVRGPLLEESCEFRSCSDVSECGAGDQVPLVLDGIRGAEWAEAFVAM